MGCGMFSVCIVLRVGCMWGVLGCLGCVFLRDRVCAYVVHAYSNLYVLTRSYIRICLNFGLNMLKLHSKLRCINSSDMRARVTVEIK